MTKETTHWPHRLPTPLPLANKTRRDSCGQNHIQHQIRQVHPLAKYSINLPAKAKGWSMRTSPRINQLLSDIQLANQIQIPLRIMLANVIQQRSSLANHPEQTASARIITGRTSHVLGHSIDSFRQHGNLHVWRTIVAVVCAELADNFLFSIFCNGHVKRNSHLFAITTSRYPGGLNFY